MPQGHELGLLGGFSLQRAGRPHAVAHGSRRLLAYLALHGPCPRGQLAGRLWPDAGEKQALASLRTSIWRVNRDLPGLLTRGEHVVALSPSVVVDSRQQESTARAVLAGTGCEGSWLRDRAHHLWAADLLPGWYDEWVDDERERLRQLRLHALERAVRILVRENDRDLALVLALEAVRVDPLRESATAVLIEVHLAEGNVVDAVRRYEQFCGRLYHDLGLDPSPRIERLLPVRQRGGAP